MKKLVILLLTGSIVVSGCKNGCGKKDNTIPGNEDSTEVNMGELADTSSGLNQQQVNTTQVIASRDSVLTGLTKQVLTIFKNKQYAKLDSLIHPDEGIRFSPYATVDLNNDKQFSRQEYKALVTKGKSEKLNWGSYDGTGEPILLTADEYFKKFVYDANFVQPDQLGIDKIIQSGNSINNLKAIYDGSNFTESSFRGSKKYGEIDWKSVRLVFKKVGEKYYLVAIVHDQWTI